jgi:hypothetical protein
MLVVPLTASQLLLDIIRAEWLVNKPLVHLYQNDFSPAVESVLADFLECDFPGYAAGQISFAAAAIDDTDHAFLEADAIVFTANADPVDPQRMYGFYVTDSLGVDLLFAERFSRRAYIRLKGNQMSVVVRFGALSEFTG